ncbi:hypothetical protein LSAT2_006093 [Lamellibrachia satsuma]|nr:hypothetical protein LSAT2_006093 [Lamellibrachia satsuma]
MTTAMDIHVGVDDNLDGHLSKLQNLVGCLQSLEDALLADEVKEGGSDSPGKKRGSWSGKTDPATPKQPKTEDVKQVEGKRMYERLTGDGRRWDRPDEKAPGETVTQTSNSSGSALTDKGGRDEEWNSQTYIHHLKDSVE